MIRRFGIAVAILCMMFVVISKASAQENWYKNKLFNGQQYVTDFTLAAGESKSVTIDSDKDTTIGFVTNISYEKGKEYIAQHIDPVELNAGDTTIKSVFGGGMRFKPVDGKITVSVINNSKEEVKIVVYKE